MCYLAENSGYAIAHLQNVGLSYSIGNIGVLTVTEVEWNNKEDCRQHGCHKTEGYYTASPMHFAYTCNIKIYKYQINEPTNTRLLLGSKLYI